MRRQTPSTLAASEQFHLHVIIGTVPTIAWFGTWVEVVRLQLDSLFFENGSGACVRVVDREKWSVRALRRIDPRTRLFFLDVLGYIAADETPLSATDVQPSFSRTHQSYPRQPSRVLRTMERRPADPAVDSICAPVSQPW